MNIIQAVLGRGLQKRSAEWLDDRYFMRQLFQDLKPTRTGKYLSLEGCLTNPTVFACVRARTESVCVLSRDIYRTRSDGGTEPIKRSDPRGIMLRRRPNPEMSPFQFEWMMGLQENIYGNSFARVVRDDKFRPVEMWPLLSRDMEVARDQKTGAKVYRYRMPNGEKKILYDWDIHHRYGPSLDGMIGLSVFELAMNSISLGLALEEYCCRIFENDASPRGMLFHKAKLSKETKDIIRAEWEKVHGGIENAGKIGILDMELDFKQVGQNNDVMQFVESYGQQREVICSWFNVPQHRAGILTRSTNNNIAQQSQDFRDNTLLPQLRMIEETLERDILTAQEVDAGMTVWHDIDDLTRGDVESQATMMNTEIQNGVRSVNEWRKKKRLNPVEGGDEHNRPLNMGVLGQDPPPQMGQNQPQNPPADPQNPAENDQNPPKKAKKRADFAAFRAIIVDACRRYIGREVIALEREHKRAKTHKEFVEACNKQFAEQKEFGEKVFLPVLESIGSVTQEIFRADQARVLREAVDYHQRSVEVTLITQMVDAEKYINAVSETGAQQLADFIIQKLEEVRNG